MKKIHILIVAPLVSLLLFTAAKYQQTNNDKEKLLVDVIMNGLAEVHFSKMDLNDDFSQKAYDLFIERMDGFQQTIFHRKRHP